MHTEVHSGGGPHEANFLKLDCSKIKSMLGWQPTWHIEKAVQQTVAFAKKQLADGDVVNEMQREIGAFVKTE